MTSEPRTSSGGTRHLGSSLTATSLSTGLSAGSSLIRIPLTISAVGATGYGVISTICSLAAWVLLVPAGARQAASAAVANDGHAEPESVAGSVARSSWRMTAPTIGIIVVLVVVAPVGTLIDPSGVMSAVELRLALLGAVFLGIASVAGAALLGATTTLGSYRLQNVAVIVSVGLVTALTAVGAYFDWSPLAFALMWCAGLAGPALTVAFRPRKFRRRPASHPNAVHSSRNSLWIAAGQQVAAGFDLVIITVIAGSLAAAEYGLWSRLVLLVVTPVIGAGPVLANLAGRARRSPTSDERAACRRIVIALLGTQCALAVVLGGVGTWTARFLSNGAISLDRLLLVAGVLWALGEAARRVALNVTATPRGLEHWRRSTLWLAIPNVALSIILTLWLGISGPMLASALAFAVALAFAAVALRSEFAAVVGR